MAAIPSFGYGRRGASHRRETGEDLSPVYRICLMTARF